ncbi:aromatic ring-hydroxylating oxygenase subunit alpha [Rhodovibrionaceae bacterium A322]
MSHQNRLPAEAYWQQDWYDREQKTLFANAWVFVGAQSDFAGPGDYRTLTSGQAPLLVIRGQDGELRAFHNLCRHRGAELVEGPQGTCKGALVCPYHRWTYGDDGLLRGLPDKSACFPDLELADWALLPAALGTFKGLVFVNPDPDADFDSWIAPLAGRDWPHDLPASDLSEAVPLLYDMKCDWKVFVENALDGYHLAYLHKETLGGPRPSLNEWERLGSHMVWYATEEGVRHRLPQAVREAAGNDGMVQSAAEPGYGGVYYLFPSTLIVPHPFGFSVSRLEPSGPGRCLMSVRQWVGPWQEKDERAQIPGYDPETDLITSDNWTIHPLESGDFQTEDVWICEKVQRGLQSPAYRPGPLAQGTGAEDPLRWFHQALAQAG